MHYHSWSLSKLMRSFFLLTFASLVLLSLVAWSIKPRPADPSKIQLIWSSDDNPNRRQQMVPFNQTHPHLELNLDPNNAEMEKVIVQSLAGVGPDLFDCYSGFALSAFVKAGIAWDVTDELKKRGIDVASETWPSVQPCAIFEGRTYGFPVNAAVNGLWFHKDLCAQAGIEFPDGPWTWQQAVPLLQKLVVRDARGKITRYGIVFDWENNYLQFIDQWGGRMYSPDGTRCTLDSPQAIAAVQFMQDLIYKYQVAPSAAAEAGMSTAGGWGAGGAGSMTLFGAKRSATALGGRWWLCRLRDPDYADLRLGLVEAPYGTVHTFVGYGKATLINKNSPHREQALAFLQYLDSRRYNELINHQADGVGPVIKYVNEPAFLHDPAYPNEDFNDVWRKMERIAQPEQVSPFMNGAVLLRLVKAQLDLVKGGDKPAASAMRDATKQINAAIQDNLRVNPALRKQWEKLTGQKSG
jgi:multiple sugar transport system substrate-binding protein